MTIDNEKLILGNGMRSLNLSDHDLIIRSHKPRADDFDASHPLDSYTRLTLAVALLDSVRIEEINLLDVYKKLTHIQNRSETIYEKLAERAEELSQAVAALNLDERK